MSNQLQVSGEAKIRAIQGPVVANSGVITALDGDASQYVRGDGTLADFPTSTGGGSSVSYYLNTSISQGTIGGVAYKQLSKVPISGAGTDVSTSVDGYIASYITDANDPALLEVPAGNFNCEFYFSVNSDAHNPYVYAEVYKYDGTTFTLLGSNVSIPQYLSNGTTLSPYYFAIAVSTSVLTVTDRIAIRIYVNVDGRTVTLHTENNHLCQVVTTFSKGIISLNNLTRQNQFFGTGTSGTDFAISSSVATHTFNLPVASAANTGKLSSTDWSTFNGKVPYTGATANVDLGLYEISAQNAFLNGVSGVNGGNLFLRQDVDFGQSAGYTTLYSTGKNLGFVSYVGSFTYNALFSLNSLTNNSTRTYTLPDLSGTLALLEGSQTFTGAKTFSNNVNLNSQLFINGGTGYGGGISFRQGIILSYNDGGTTTEFPDANSIKYYVGQGSNTYKNFVFDVSNITLNATRTFEFPDASGTIALISNLSSYVPYTGATANVDLGNNSLSLGTAGTAGSSITLLGTLNDYIVAATVGCQLRLLPDRLKLIDNQFGGSLSLYFRATGLNTGIDRLIALPNADGTIALTSDLSAYVTLATAQTISGAKTFSAALSGTSATFSLDATINGVNVGRGGGNISSNTANGVQALYYNTTGGNNTAIGAQALLSNTTGISNTANGVQALVNNTTGSANTANGVSALFSNTTGASNIAIGKEALYYNTTGGSNTANGNNALYYNTTGSNNTANGYHALLNNTTGSNNTALGLNAGNAITTGSNNTIIGSYVGTAALANNIVLADGAGNIRYQWNGTNNVFGNPISGTSATFSSNITVNSVQIGSAGNTTNIKLGDSTFGAITTGSNNIAIGSSALTSITTSNANIGIGNSALASVVDGAFNTAIGFGIGGSITSGSNNALFGYGAGSAITTGNYNTILGAYAGTAGMSNNIVLADGAGNIRYQWNGTNNVFTGAATFSSSGSFGNGTLNGAQFIIKGANGAPATSGTTTTAVLRLSSGTGLYNVLDFGTNESLDYSWIQSTRANSLGTYDYLAIQPNGGNLLIGTLTNSTYKLDVNGTGRFSGNISMNSGLANIQCIGSGQAILRFDGGDSRSSYFGKENGSGTYSWSSGGTAYATVICAYNQTAPIQFGHNSPAMTITSAGNVSIGTGLTAANSFNFYQNYSGGQLGFDFYNSSSQIVFGFNGNTQTIGLKGLSGTGSRTVLADANGSLSAPVSDISVKQNIVPIGYGLNEILKMNPVWFDFINEYKNYGETRQNGNIAQEMESIIPEAVFTTELTGKMGINYDQLHAVYIKAIQELSAKNDALETRLQLLENK